jgi:hypothetical protein
MSLNLKDAKKGMGDRALAPIGNHIARCYQLVDLGTQDDARYGNASHKLRIAWELCEEFADFGKGKKEPYSVSMTVNFFFGRNSNFTKVLEGWKGGTFSEAELDNFELRKLVGKACMVNVVHATSGDRDYANVASVSPVPAKWKDRVPAMHNPPVYFEVEMGPSSREFVMLPEFLQKIIAKCHEWRDTGVSMSESTASDPFADEDEETEKANAAAAEAKRNEEDDDQIPF